MVQIIRIKKIGLLHPIIVLYIPHGSDNTSIF